MHYKRSMPSLTTHTYVWRSMLADIIVPIQPSETYLCVYIHVYKVCLSVIELPFSALDTVY